MRKITSLTLKTPHQISATKQSRISVNAMIFLSLK